jgi:hypothetical protein
MSKERIRVIRSSPMRQLLPLEFHTQFRIPIHYQSTIKFEESEMRS